MKRKVLFICVHNSARSQIAEAFLNNLAKDMFEAKSAGIEPGRLNPIVVEVMKEKGIDISLNKTKNVELFINSKEKQDFVIIVCSEADSERCPIFPEEVEVLQWSFDDPSKFEGSYKEKLEKTRLLRDQIEVKIKEWISSFKNE